MRVDYEEFKEKLPELMGKFSTVMNKLLSRKTAYL